MDAYQLPTASQHVLNVFIFFLKHYSPATETKSNNVIEKTTSEIFKELQQHCPSEEYSAETVYAFLLANGFKYETPGGELDFIWKLKYNK